MKKSKVLDTDTPTSDRRHMHWDKKNALIGIVVAVVLLAAGIGWVMYQRSHKPQGKVVPKDIIAQALNNPSKAKTQTLLDALASNPTKDQRLQLLQLLANNYQQVGDYKTAVSYMVQAYNAGLADPLLTENIGFLYLNKLNDKSQALKYFNISLQEAKSSQASYAPNIVNTLNKNIKALEDQGVKASN